MRRQGTDCLHARNINIPKIILNDDGGQTTDHHGQNHVGQLRKKSLAQDSAEQGQGSHAGDIRIDVVQV